MSKRIECKDSGNGKEKASKLALECADCANEDLEQITESLAQWIVVYDHNADRDICHEDSVDHNQKPVKDNKSVSPILQTIRNPRSSGLEAMS